MPIYDYKCEDCGKDLNDVFQKDWDSRPNCCGKPMVKKIASFNGYVFPAEGITLTNVEAQPKTFHSTKEMRTYAKAKNLELGALL